MAVLLRSSGSKNIRKAKSVCWTTWIKKRPCNYNIDRSCKFHKDVCSAVPLTKPNRVKGTTATRIIWMSRETKPAGHTRPLFRFKWQMPFFSCVQMPALPSEHCLLLHNVAQPSRSLLHDAGLQCHAHTTAPLHPAVGLHIDSASYQCLHSGSALCQHPLPHPSPYPGAWAS